MGVKCLTPFSKLNVFLVHFARLAELKVTPANLLIHQAMHVLKWGKGLAEFKEHLEPEV